MIPEEPSRLIFPREHRKWAEAVANAKAAERRAEFNANMRDTLKKCKIEKKKALEMFEARLIADFGEENPITIGYYMKRGSKVADEKINSFMEKMKTARERSVSECRAEALRKCGY